MAGDGTEHEDNGMERFCGSLINNKRRQRYHQDPAYRVFRGLLCIKCNAVLGMAEDSTIILEKAIVYLKERSNL